MRVYHFVVPIGSYQDVPYMTTFPIYDKETEVLVGAFTTFHSAAQVGRMMSAFISGVGYPLALSVSTGGSFWITLVLDERGMTKSAFITAEKYNEDSIFVSEATE